MTRKQRYRELVGRFPSISEAAASIEAAPRTIYAKLAIGKYSRPITKRDIMALEMALQNKSPD